MRKSINKRITGYFVLIILIAVLFFETILIWAVNLLFHNSLENVLQTQLNYSIEYYTRYYSTSKLEDLILEDVDIFWQHTNAEVQILSKEGELLSDSIGLAGTNLKNSVDIIETLQNGRGVSIETPTYSDSSVMAVSGMITVDGKDIGILRFVSSLKYVNNNLRSIYLILLFIGLLVIAVSAIISKFLANSIVRPLEEVTNVAEKMADGHLKVHSEVDNEDEIGKLAETLNYMAEELIKKEEIKNDFISSISHELRTPLTSIKGWAITIKDEPLGESVILKEGLDVIERESDRLTGMVEELLDFSRFVSGRISMNKDFFHLGDMLERTVVEMNPRGENHFIKLRSFVDESVKVLLLDENRIKQVVINLLDNAIKFSKPGGFVDLYANYEEGTLTIRVEDTGIGVSKEDLPHIKEKFYRGNNSASHSGLGLSICDEIVKLHNGTIDVYSELGEGTEVIVQIPCEEVQNA